MSNEGTCRICENTAPLARRGTVVGFHLLHFSLRDQGPVSIRCPGAGLMPARDIETVDVTGARL